MTDWLHEWMIAKKEKRAKSDICSSMLAEARAEDEARTKMRKNGREKCQPSHRKAHGENAWTTKITVEKQWERLQNANTHTHENWVMIFVFRIITSNSSSSNSNDSSSYCHQHQVMFQFFIRLPFRFHRFVLHFVGYAFKFIYSSFGVHI